MIDVFGQYHRPKRRHRNASLHWRDYLMSKSGGRCEYCYKSLKTREMTVDHVRPLSRGGGGSRDNLACSCRRCNENKADQLISEMQIEHLATASRIILACLRSGTEPWDGIRRNKLRIGRRTFNEILRRLSESEGVDLSAFEQRINQRNTTPTPPAVAEGESK